MKYVLDSSAAIPVLLPEPLSPKAISLRDDFRNSIHELISLDIFPAELFNALLKDERKKRIAVGNAKKLIASYTLDMPGLRPYLPLMDRAGEISSRYRFALYDCLYIALSEQESCELVTADTTLANALQIQFPQIVHLSAMP